MGDAIAATVLGSRSPRPPDYEAETRVLAALMQALAGCDGEKSASDTPASSCILQRLVESAIELCHAHSAGISLLERGEGPEQLRWRAVAGQWAKYRGGTMARDRSPCGTVIDRNTALLFVRPERRFPLPAIEPPVAEALLIPFHCSGEPVGTLWIVAHDETRRFDAEDLRLMTSLSRFASAAYQLQIDREARERATELLQSELEAARRLQETSLQLIQAGEVEALYTQILDAVADVMRSDCASIQLLRPESASGGELHLLGQRGLDAQAVADRQRIGLSQQSACAAALRTRRRIVVPDTEACNLIVDHDEREFFRRNGIRALQGTPLLSRDGQALGLVSTYWRQPHHPSARDLRFLDVLARQIADLIERSRAEAALRESEQRFRVMADTAPAILCVTEPDGSCSFMSQGWYNLTGQGEERGLGFGWLEAVHPDDRATTQAEYLAANARAEAFAREHRVRRADGEYRWTLCAGRPRFGAGGCFAGYMVSIIDITERKQAEEHTMLLMCEASHRSKNLLAVVQALARRTAGEDQPETFPDRFGERLAGLAACLDLLVQNDWRGVDAGELVRSQLAHFIDRIGSSIVLDGPPLPLSPSAAQAIGMALHELATNAGKYGALSEGTGTVSVSWDATAGSQPPRFRMCWKERGGPAVMAPKRHGFGHTLMVQTVELALEAEVALHYAPDGLVWSISAPTRSVLSPEPITRPH